jgi:hypothetical protein
MALMQIQSPPPGATVEGWIALCVGEATEVARVWRLMLPSLSHQ